MHEHAAGCSCWMLQAPEHCAHHLCVHMHIIKPLPVAKELNRGAMTGHPLAVLSCSS